MTTILRCNTSRAVLCAASMAVLWLPLAALAGTALERIDVRHEQGHYVLAGEIVIDAPRAAVYAVITDFDALKQLDEGIADSYVVERINASTTLVYTRLSGCVFVFCRDVERLERVEQLSDTEIVAAVVPGQPADIRYARSRWVLSSEGDTVTRVVYETEIDPAFWVPPVIGPAMLRRVLRQRVAATLGKLERAARERL